VWQAGSSAPRPAQFAVDSLTITNTLANHNLYGAFASDAGIGTQGLTALTRSFHWTHNVLAGGAGQTYPSVTWQPNTETYRAQFNADYSLVAGSIYLGAGTDQLDLGASLLSSGSSGVTIIPGPPGLPRIQKSSVEVASPTRITLL
jgi:hypothetical protein